MYDMIKSPFSFHQTATTAMKRGNLVSRSARDPTFGRWDASCTRWFTPRRRFTIWPTTWAKFRPSSIRDFRSNSPTCPTPIWWKSWKNAWIESRRVDPPSMSCWRTLIWEIESKSAGAVYAWSDEKCWEKVITFCTVCQIRQLIASCWWYFVLILPPSWRGVSLISIDHNNI